jgi:hypothetical protein
LSTNITPIQRSFSAAIYCTPNHPVPDLLSGTILVTKGKIEHAPRDFIP